MAPRKKTVKIADWMIPVLRKLDIEGPTVRITQQLERADYVALDKLLKALGGKWNRKQKMHIFPSDAQPLLDAALAQGGALDKKKTYQQFDTPPELARRMVELAEIDEWADVLEPSAGLGNLVKAIHETGVYPQTITMVELDPNRAEALRQAYPEMEHDNVLVVEGDFLEGEGDVVPFNAYDVVLMNPPFSAASTREDLDHVWRAWHHLRSGGRLVAVIAPATDTAVYRAFEKWLVEIGAESHEIPEGSFKGSGTGVNAQLIVAKRGEVEEIVYPTRQRRRGRPPLVIPPGSILDRMGVK